MSLRPDNPLIVQSDRSLMLHTVRAVVDGRGVALKDEAGEPLTEEHPRFAAARDALSVFAELEKSPDYLHTYRITPVSIWNAAAMGKTAEDIAAVLAEFACVPVPKSVLHEIHQWVGRYGLLRIERRGERFELTSEQRDSIADVLGHEAAVDSLRAAVVTVPVDVHFHPGHCAPLKLDDTGFDIPTRTHQTRSLGGAQIARRRSSGEGGPPHQPTPHQTAKTLAVDSRHGGVGIMRVASCRPSGRVVRH